MSLLEVKNLSHSFKDKELFKNISLKVFENEHIGLVGKNGAGKSTFMKIISKLESSDEGDIIWTNNVRVGYMDQHLELGDKQTVIEYLRCSYNWLFELEQEMISIYEKIADVNDDEQYEKMMNRAGIISDMLNRYNFYDIDVEIKKVASGLGIDESWFNKNVSELSGGQRTKILLINLLLRKPDVLLLDEPTNYLDEGHIKWLQSYLKEYENTFILISHDIPFLNSVCNIIYHLENKQITRYKGDYDNFVKVYELEKEKLHSSYERQQKQIKKMETFIAKNIARSSTSARAKSRQKALDKIERIEIVNDNTKMSFGFEESRQSDKVLYETKDLIIGYESALSIPLNLKVEKGQKIVLVGTNGLGKSTLIKTIIEIIKPFSGKVIKGQYIDIGYFEQENKITSDITTYDDVYNYFTGDKKTQQFVRMSLSKCGINREHVNKKLKLLSGGEQAKVRLCKIMNTPTNLLVLDEPTNHLDKQAKEELKKALINYKGTLLLVSHEPEFYKDICDIVWDCSKFNILKE